MTTPPETRTPEPPPAGSPTPQPSSDAEAPRRSRLGRALRVGCLGVVGLVLVVVLGFWIWWSADVADPFPDYALSIDLQSPPDGDGLRVGAAAIDITPEITDVWTDADADGEYEPEDGETYEDVNGNGVFDAVWMAGYGTGRPATGVHDPLWARAVVLEVNGLRLGVVALDLVGLFHTDVIRIRKAIGETAGESGGREARPLVDHLVVASTHGHEGPDTMGLWGPDDTTSGVDPAYMDRVRRSVKDALELAVSELRPARASFHSTRYGNKLVMYDHRRRPDVVDDTLAVVRFVEREGDATIATLVNWSNHPETMGDEQTLITSDFCHWLREGIENGVGAGGRDPVEGLGGVCVFVNGSVGGMMTSLRMPIPDRETGAPIPEKSEEHGRFPWARARSVGEHVAARALRLVAEGGPPIEVDRLRIRAKTFGVAMQNILFKIGAKLGRLDRGSFDGAIRTEAAVIDIGPARIATIPGEIYPEIVIGGIERPEGADFEIDPVEIPPLKEVLAEDGVEHVLIFGLANDEIGYLIPKSEWDAPDGLPWDGDGNPPYLYGADGPPYGEINSCGPDAAKAVHDAITSLVRGDRAP